jgi:hypothetical protein
MLTKLRLAGTINCGAILRHVILDATLASAGKRLHEIILLFLIFRINRYKKLPGFTGIKPGSFCFKSSCFLIFAAG